MKRLKQTYNLLLAALIPVLLFIACQDSLIDLCYESEHPHRAGFIIDFDFGEYEGAEPDSMLIIGNRIINTWRVAYMISTAKDTLDRRNGTYLWNEPYVEDPGKDENGSYIKPDFEHIISIDSVADDTDYSNQMSDLEWRKLMESWGLRAYDTIRIKPGEYKFYAFSIDTTSYRMTRIYNYLADSTNTASLSGMELAYRPLKRGDKRLRNGLEWDDFNEYTDYYIQPNQQAIMYDTLEYIEVHSNQEVRHVFKPVPVSQRININFDIKKDISSCPFTIDSVLCDIGGIPSSINLTKGYIDIRKTYKMLFSTELRDDENRPISHDTQNSELVRCHGEIEVPSIVQNKDSLATSGPGILQIHIYCSTTHNLPGEQRPPTPKCIKGKVNIYHALNNAVIDVGPLHGINSEEGMTEDIDMGDDGGLIMFNYDRTRAYSKCREATVNIKADIVVHGEDILNNRDKVNDWSGGGNLYIDI